MLELVIVRHGESEGNAAQMFTGHGPSPLTARGRRQAMAMAAVVAQKPLTALYVSDLPRAMQTLEPLASLTGLEPRVRPQLRERDMGAWVGVTFRELEAQHPEGWAALRRRDPDHAPPGGESHRQCAARLAAFADTLRAEHPEGRVALVSPGVAIHHLLAHLVGLRANDTVFTTENCAIHRVELHRDGRVRVGSLNDTHHLAGL